MLAMQIIYVTEKISLRSSMVCLPCMYEDAVKCAIPTILFAMKGMATYLSQPGSQSAAPTKIVAGSGC